MVRPETPTTILKSLEAVAAELGLWLLLVQFRLDSDQIQEDPAEYPLPFVEYKECDQQQEDGPEMESSICPKQETLLALLPNL